MGKEKYITGIRIGYLPITASFEMKRTPKFCVDIDITISKKS